MRHGKSKADDEKCHEGRYDSPLTVLGEKQAQLRALKWKEQGIKFTKIITSPLLRAYSTAKIIGEILNVPVETCDLWMEMDNGKLAGLKFEEAARKFPVPDFRGPYTRMANGTGESLWQVRSRAIQALEKIIQYSPGTFLIVAHGKILNAALRSILGSPPPVNNSGIYFAFGDTAYLHVQYNIDKHIWIIKEFVPGE